MSSTKSSSSSVKNMYSSSSHSSNSRKKYNSDFENRFNYIKCKCDIVAPCQEAWREGTMDPGRRFFGCSQYKDPSKKCNFFLWADPPYTDRAREVIEELKGKLRARDDELKRAMAELHFVERKMMVLNEECVSLREKNAGVAALVHKKDGCKMKLWCILIVVITFLFFRLFK